MNKETEPYTDSERSAAEELGIPVQTLRLHLDTYMKHCKLAAQQRRKEKEKNQ